MFKLNEGIDEYKNYIKSKDDKLYQLLTNNNDRILKRLISLDPTSDIKKNIIGKYVKWLVILLKNNDSELNAILSKSNKEDDYKITNTLKIFDNNKKLLNSDIFKYKNLEKLIDAVDNIVPKNLENIDESNIKEDLKKGNITFFGQTPKWLIIIPNNKEAACEYGEGTNWCTANKTYNAFDSYRKDKLYIFLNKKDKLKPEYQFYFLNKQFMNERDKPIDIVDFFNDNIDVYNLFFPDVKNKIENEKDLNEEEMTYLPDIYIDYYLKNINNEFFHLLVELSKKSIDLEYLENNKKFIGFNGKEFEIYYDNLKVKNINYKEFYNILDNDELDMVYFERILRDGADDYFEDFSYNDSDDNIVKPALDNKKVFEVISDIFYFFDANMNLQSGEEVFNFLKECGLYDDFFKDRLAHIYSEESNQRLDEFMRDIERRNPIEIDDYNKEMNINYKKVYRFLIKNKQDIYKVNSFEDFVKSESYLDFMDQSYGIYNISEYIYTNADASGIEKEALDILKNIEDNLSYYEEKSKYWDYIKNYIEIGKEFKKQKIEIGETYKTIDGEDFTILGYNKDGKVKIKLENGNEIDVNPKSINDLRFNYKLKFKNEKMFINFEDYCKLF